MTPLSSSVMDMAIWGAVSCSKLKVRVAAAELAAAEFQDFSDSLPNLLEVKARTNVPMTFRIEVTLGDGKEPPPKEAVDAVNDLLRKIKKDFYLA